MEVEAERGHAEPAQLDDDVGTPGQVLHVLLPDRQGLGLLAGILADAEMAADMVDDDGLTGEGAGCVQQVGKLRKEVPGVESKSELAELGEAFAELRIEQAMAGDRPRDM